MSTTRRTLRVALPMLAALVWTSGCIITQDHGEWAWAEGGEMRPDDNLPSYTPPVNDPGVSGTWQAQPSYSPTGTALVPDPSGVGYQVVDEVCGAVSDAGYADRFLTAMFRDVHFEDGLAYLVDGSHLWVLDAEDPAAPVRLLVEPLEGHPLAVHVQQGWLWVATVDAGLRGYPLSASGLPDLAAEPQILFDDGVTRVMDVAGDGTMLFAALGARGVAAIRVDEGLAGAVYELPAGPYAASVTVSDDALLVAACDRVWIYALPTLELVDDFAVPFGSAKGVAIDGDVIVVPAGQALLFFRLEGDSAVYLGYHKQELDGFYANDAVVQDGIAYLAAGDEAVSAISVHDTELTQGVEITWEEPASGPDSAVVVGTADVVSQHQVYSDPIAVGLHRDHLYALGNLRYLGERTAEIFDVSVPAWLRPVGEYVQPNLGVGLSRMGDLLVVHGSDGRHRVISIAAANPALAGDFEATTRLRGTLSHGVDLYLYGDGPLTRARAGLGEATDLEAIVDQGLSAHSFVLDETRGYLADANRDGIVVFERDSGLEMGLLTASDGFLGSAELALVEGRLLAYDRVLGELRSWDTSTSLPTPASTTFVGLCEAYGLADFYSLAVNARARFVEGGGQSALVCPSRQDGSAELIGVSLAETGEVVVAAPIPLPATRIADASFTSRGLVLASFDNTRYQSRVVVCDRDTGAPLAERTFTGQINAVLEVGDAIFAVDGAFGLRVLTSELEPALTQPLGL